MLRRLAMDISPLRDSRPFRNVFVARTVSVFGIGMLAVALPVQVYDMTGSTVQVGGVSAAEGSRCSPGSCGAASSPTGTTGGGSCWARAAVGIGFVLLALNAFLPSPSLAALYVLAAWDGLATGVSVTALLAATPSLVKPDKLVAAGALNALTVRLGSMASPALGGLVVSAFGVGWNYAAAAAGTVGTIGLLTALPPLKPAAADEPQTNPLKAIGDGFRFVASHRVVGSLMLLGLLFMVAGGIPVLMPAFATRSLDGGATTVGLLFAAPACGAVLASVTSGWAGSAKPLDWRCSSRPSPGSRRSPAWGWPLIRRSPSRSCSCTGSWSRSRRSSGTG